MVAQLFFFTAAVLLRTAWVVPAQSSEQQDSRQCCCHTCMASGCVAEMVSGCSSCDPDGCGKSGIPGTCNGGRPAGRPGLPPNKTMCRVPAVPDQELINTPTCDCSWINGDTCMNHDVCAISCRRANPRGPCGQCHWQMVGESLKWICPESDREQRRSARPRTDLQCCCHICSAGGCGAQLVRNCSSCDKKGCGQGDAPGECNGGYPAGRAGLPPDDTMCTVPVTQDEDLVSTDGCDCSCLNRDSCMRGDACARSCRAANPTGPCGQCFWSQGGQGEPSTFTCETATSHLV
jgi:hypothetical protein